MLIGIVGKAGSGKDTVADHLCKNHGFTKGSFAAKLKSMCRDLFDLSDAQVGSDCPEREVVDERYGITPRRILQLFGTEGCRAIYENVWVDYLMRVYHHDAEMFAKNPHIDQDFHFVVSDVRFLNEAKAIHDNGGVVWRVVCPDNPRDLGSAEGAAHASELEQDAIVPEVELLARYGDLPRLFGLADLEVTKLQEGT